MNDAHQTLLDLLAVEPLEVDLFRGTGKAVNPRPEFLAAK